MPGASSRPSAGAMNALAVQATGYELRFVSLFHPGRAFAFPCDAQGRMALEAMSMLARASYLRVLARVGCELAAPIVVPASN